MSVLGTTKNFRRTPLRLLSWSSLPPFLEPFSAWLTLSRSRIGRDTVPPLPSSSIYLPFGNIKPPFKSLLQSIVDWA